MANKLSGAPVKHWSEAAQPMTGLARIDGQGYRWMGGEQRLPEKVQVMEQASAEVMPPHTRYRFSGGGVEMKVTFYTASFPEISTCCRGP